MKRIARFAMTSVGTAKRRLREFEAAGVVVVFPQEEPETGRTTSNRYHLALTRQPESFGKVGKVGLDPEDVRTAEDGEGSKLNPSPPSQQAESGGTQQSEPGGSHLDESGEGLTYVSPLEESDRTIPPLSPELPEPSFAEFAGRHPDPNAMGDAAAIAEWKAMSSSQRRRAYEMAEPYARLFDGKNRGWVRAGHWLKNKMFDDAKLKVQRVSAADFRFVKRDSDEHRSWLVFRFVLTGVRRIYTAYRPSEGCEGWDAPTLLPGFSAPLELPPEGAQAAAGWFFLQRGSQNWGAWQTWLHNCPKPPGSVWARTHSPVDEARGGWWFPHPWPPRADGTFSPLTDAERGADATRMQDEQFLEGGGSL
ncbi:hypothetical protein [Terrihabitans soli]|nr:hypothetical protein [Terrihabitans soli]